MRGRSGLTERSNSSLGPHRTVLEYLVYRKEAKAGFCCTRVVRVENCTALDKPQSSRRECPRPRISDRLHLESNCRRFGTHLGSGNIDSHAGRQRTIREVLGVSQECTLYIWKTRSLPANACFHEASLQGTPWKAF